MKYYIRFWQKSIPGIELEASSRKEVICSSLIKKGQRYRIYDLEGGKKISRDRWRIKGDVGESGLFIFSPNDVQLYRTNFPVLWEK